MCEAGAGPDSMIALVRLEGAMRHATHTLKYGDRPQLAAHLVRATWRPDRVGPGAIIPVPLLPSRRRRRGYNQAALLGAELARLSGGQVVEGLRRDGPPGRQVGRGGEDRRRSLVGAFTWSSASIPKSILLLDDVLTTGATLMECALAARAAGVERVDALAVALG